MCWEDKNSTNSEGENRDRIYKEVGVLSFVSRAFEDMLRRPHEYLTTTKLIKCAYSMSECLELGKMVHYFAIVFHLMDSLISKCRKPPRSA